MRSKYRFWVALALLAGGTLGCGGDPTKKAEEPKKGGEATGDKKGTPEAEAEAASIRTIKIKVFRHSTVALTNAEADTIVGQMGTALQTKDTTGDVATAVKFVRDGNVQLLPSNVAAVIQTQSQLNALFAAPKGVKIVRRIQFCGGPGGSIIGCAPVGSSTVNIAAVRFTTGLEGILWAHEYGHNCGLNHRTNDGNAIMFPSIGSTHKVVNAPESKRYLSGPGAVAAAAAEAAPPAADPEEAPPPAPKDVRDFVRQHYFEGVPFERAIEYRAADREKEAVDTLLKMLDDPAEKEFLPEIVTTLCYIGSDRAAAPLVKFVYSDRTGPDEFHAKNAALIHLGDLVHHSKNKEALDCLKNFASKPAEAQKVAKPRAAAAAAAAAAEVAKGADVTPPTEAELAAELAVSAAQGLSLTGQEDAENALQALSASAEAAPVLKEVAAEAKKTSARVRAVGQQKFYAEMKQHKHDHDEKKP